MPSFADRTVELSGSLIDAPKGRRGLGDFWRPRATVRSRRAWAPVSRRGHLKWRRACWATPHGAPTPTRRPNIDDCNHPGNGAAGRGTSGRRQSNDRRGGLPGELDEAAPVLAKKMLELGAGDVVVLTEDTAMTSTEGPYDEPSDVTAVEGDVDISGPDSVDVSMTPEAAEITAGRLVRAAQTAKGQKPQKRS